MTIAGLTCAAWIAVAPSALVPAVPTSAAATLPDSRADLSAEPSPDAAARHPEPSSAADGNADAAAPASAAGTGGLPFPVPTPAPSILPIRPPSDPELVRRDTLRASGAVLLAVPVLGELLWWRNEETERFHTTRENWFSKDTYAGGADKVSHVFGGYAFSRELAWQFEKLGNSPARSRALATGMAALTGVLVEGGDGFSVYGFSWEDVFSDLVGSAFAAAIGAAKIDDLVGIRLGYVRTKIPPKCCRATAYGSDYSREIYSFDVRLDSALRRLGVAKPGPARFLLLSLTYGSKGYRFSPVESRERNVGFDLGLNVVEVLRAVGVREDTWWGLPILRFFNYYRLEYTAWGWRYDFNHGRWSGFGTGGRFDPGRVIYR